MYLTPTDIQESIIEKIDDLAYVQETTLHDLAENTFFRTFDVEQTARLRREATFEQVIFNLIDFGNQQQHDNLSRLTKSASVYNVYLKNKLISSALLDRSKTDFSTESLRHTSASSNETQSESKQTSLSTQFNLLNSSKTNKSKKSRPKKYFNFRRVAIEKKMNRLDAGSFYLAPLDHEYKDFVKQKKEIKEKLHDHWKIELNSHQKNKTLRINNDMFNSEQQWMTIANNAGSVSREEKDQDRIESSLIETFTANLDNQTNDKLESYKVNSEVGTLIAQKLLKGEKIRVGRNGAVPDLDGGRSISKLFQTFKIPSQGSILSWNDQVNKGDIKIIEPKVSSSENQRKTKPERNLIVKKLNEEEEFIPVIKKSTQLSSQSHSTSPVSTTHTEQMNKLSPAKLFETKPTVVTAVIRNPKPAVEVVGSNAVGHPYKQHLLAQSIKVEQQSNKNSKTDWSLDSALVRTKSASSNNKHQTPTVKSVINNLSEKNYLQIIDNLTSRYTSTLDSTKNKSTDADTASVVKKKVTNNTKDKLKEKRVKLEFINDLGLKSMEPKTPKRKGTASSSNVKSHSENNFNNLNKLHENTNYFNKNITPNTSNNINNNNNRSIKSVDINKNTKSENKIETIANNNDNNNNTNNYVSSLKELESKRSNSPRTYSSFSHTYKASVSNETNTNKKKSIKNAASSTGLNTTSSVSITKNFNLHKSSLSRKRVKSSKITESNSTYIGIVKQLLPSITRKPDFKQIVFDINQFEDYRIMSPSTSLVTH